VDRPQGARRVRESLTPIGFGNRTVDQPSTNEPTNSVLVITLVNKGAALAALLVKRTTGLEPVRYRMVERKTRS